MGPKTRHEWWIMLMNRRLSICKSRYSCLRRVVQWEPITFRSASIPSKGCCVTVCQPVPSPLPAAPVCAEAGRPSVTRQSHVKNSLVSLGILKWILNLILTSVNQIIYTFLKLKFFLRSSFTADSSLWCYQQRLTEVLPSWSSHSNRLMK